MKFYKGDIVYKGEDAEMHWGVDLVGIVQDITELDLPSWKLFYRPFKNWIKAFFKK
jgi:hypothetical protein